MKWKNTNKKTGDENVLIIKLNIIKHDLLNNSNGFMLLIRGAGQQISTLDNLLISLCFSPSADMNGLSRISTIYDYLFIYSVNHNFYVQCSILYSFLNVY